MKDRIASVHEVGDNGARESLVLGVAVKTCHNILDGRRWIWFPVFASRFDNEARQPKVEKLNVWMFEKIARTDSILLSSLLSPRLGSPRQKGLSHIAPRGDVRLQIR